MFNGRDVLCITYEFSLSVLDVGRQAWQNGMPGTQMLQAATRHGHKGEGQKKMLLGKLHYAVPGQVWNPGKSFFMGEPFPLSWRDVLCMYVCFMYYACIMCMYVKPCIMYNPVHVSCM